MLLKGEWERIKEILLQIDVCTGRNWERDRVEYVDDW
jgi:hypothetical protein